jgi:hypothetical protein
MDGSMMLVLYGGGTSVLKTPATKRPSEVAIAGNETDEAAGCAPSYYRDIQWIHGCVGVDIHRYPVVVALEGNSDSRE